MSTKVDVTSNNDCSGGILPGGVVSFYEPNGLIEEEINATNCMEEVQRSVEKYTDGCPGKLTMRAAGGDGVTYEATICRSPINGADGKQYVEPVITRRYPS